MASLTSDSRPGMEHQKEFMFQIINFRNPNAISQNDDGTFVLGVSPLLASDLELDNPTHETTREFRARKMGKAMEFNDMLLDKINMVERFRYCVGFAEGDMAERPVKKKAKKAQDFWLSLLDLSKTKRTKATCRLRDGTERNFQLYDWKTDDGNNGEKNCATAANKKGFAEFQRAILFNILNSQVVVDTMENRSNVAGMNLLGEIHTAEGRKKEAALKKSEKNRLKKDKQKAKKAAKAAEKAAKKAAKEEEKKLIAEQNRIKREEAAFRKAKQEAEKQAKQEAEKQARIAKKKMKKQMKKQAKAATKIQAIARGMNERSPPPSPTPQQDFKNLLQRTRRDLRKYKNMKAGKTRRKKKQRKRRKSKRRTRNKRGGLLLLGAYAAYKFLTKKNKKKRRRKTKKR